MRLHFFNSAVIANSKMGYWSNVIMPVMVVVVVVAVVVMMMMVMMMMMMVMMMMIRMMMILNGSSGDVDQHHRYHLYNIGLRFKNPKG